MKDPEDDLEDDFQDWNDIDLQIVSITMNQLLRAQAKIASCEACNIHAEIPFDLFLREVAQEKGADYIIPEPAVCPRCGTEVYEKTLVQPKGGVEVGRPTG